MTPIFPKAGTPAHDEFMRKTRDPNSVEAGMLRKVVSDSTDQTQQAVRTMLHEMIRLVPGQLFRDIGLFHEKFGLAPTEDHGHQLPEDVLAFRAKFLLEELKEYLSAVGLQISWGSESGLHIKSTGEEFNPEQALDGLVDLCYVALGTAYLHRFLFNEAWSRVQEANMAKVRSVGDDDPLSVRKSKSDVVKPPGWKPPVLVDLLDGRCENCVGSGKTNEHGIVVPCIYCKGTGRRRRGPAEETTA